MATGQCSLLRLSVRRGLGYDHFKGNGEDYTMKRISMIVAVILAAVTMTLGSSAHTQSPYNMTWKFKSDYKYKVQVSFFSKSRNVVWPGNGQAYNLDDSQVHEIKLNCLGGEKICYGGWVTGNSKLFWGVGSDGKRGCDDCCYTCNNNQTPILRLRN